MIFFSAPSARSLPLVPSASRVAIFLEISSYFRSDSVCRNTASYSSHHLRWRGGGVNKSLKDFEKKSMSVKLVKSNTICKTI